MLCTLAPAALFVPILVTSMAQHRGVAKSPSRKPNQRNGAPVPHKVEATLLPQPDPSLPTDPQPLFPTIRSPVSLGINFSDPERTILDFIYLWRYNGVPDEKIVAGVSEWAKNISKEKTKSYARKYLNTVAEIAERVI